MRTTNALLAGVALLCFASAANATTYYSRPTYGQPNYAQPRHSQPTYGQPGYGQPGYGQPQGYTRPSPTYRQPQGYYAPGAYQTSSPFSQYVTIRGTYSKMTNDVEADYKYTNGVGQAAENLSGDLDDDTFGASFAYGIKYNMFRAELEGIWNTEAESFLFDINTDENKAKVSNKAVMLNLYADFDNPTNITPYIGGGVGLSWLKADYYAGEKEKVNLAWQIGAGANIAASENVSFDIGYRYMYNGKLTINDVVYDPLYNIYEERHFKLESYSHNIYLGLRYSF